MAAIIVMILGASVIALLMQDGHDRGTPFTALLAVTIIVYALVSGRLREPRKIPFP